MRHQQSMKWDLNGIGAEVKEISESKGWQIAPWEDQYGVPAKLALIHSEVSEALEAFRIDDRLNFEEELADVIIRTLHLASALGIDMDTTVRNKMDKNKKRKQRHGGKRL